MRPFSRGVYAARLAETPADVASAQRLRHQAFIAARAGAVVEGPRALGLDADHLDDICDHMLVEERKTGRLVCCFRMLPLNSGAEIGRTYSAQYYDLAALGDYPAPMVEMGRFCLLPGLKDHDVIRVAWGAMTEYVDERGVEMLFG